MARKKIIIGGILLLIQLIFFSEYILPFHWGHLKVEGLVCTCPDETVIGGQLYLKSITPDSLKKYNLDYSEIYVTKRPSSNSDPMGGDVYIIKGAVIGKERVSEGDPWNPKFRVDEWKEAFFLKEWVIKVLFFGQLITFGFVLVNKKILQ